ncbi:MAG: DUF2520 domain-containing protein [Saprospiraceae bacterium]|nr:MAG: oxidoreductase [Candidatus Parvibacillus calidus]MCC7150159.1 DUF2520 domain-containing protein [Saprospiraceae bacterium]
MSEVPNRIQIVGTGNIAFHVASGLAKQQTVHAIRINARSETHHDLFMSISPKIEFCINEKPDFTYPFTIIAVSDDAIGKVAEAWSGYPHLIVHTAGSVPIDVLKKAGINNFGALYPLQTFSINRKINWKKIPIFINANNEENLNKIYSVARLLSPNIIPITDSNRLALHIGAVIANNFTNHLFAIADKWLVSNDLKFEYLLPLIRETVDKLEEMSPFDAQTGPAKRNDRRVINKHMGQLEGDQDLKELYLRLTESIFKFHHERGF